jgi:hypothetical protein
MPDFFTRLIARSNGTAPAVRPLTAPIFAQGPAVAEEKTLHTPEKKSFEAPQVWAEARAPHESSGRERQEFEPRTTTLPLRVEKAPDSLEKIPPESAPLTSPVSLGAPEHELALHFAERPSTHVNGAWHGETVSRSNDAKPYGQEQTRPKATSGTRAQVPAANSPLEHPRSETRMAPSLLPISHQELNTQQDQGGTHCELPTTRNIRVTIGRVDVRAILPSRETSTRSKSTGKPAAVSLEEYLKQRKAGQR